MIKVDWSKAPEGAEVYADGKFYRNNFGTIYWHTKADGWQPSMFKKLHGIDELACYQDYEVNLRAWPEEERIDIIGQQGNTGEHYQPDVIGEPIEAQDFLSAGLKILGERGRQYGSNERECSFPQAAQAFNAITGNNLKGSDICLILSLVKQVRQYAQPERFHEDSAVDGVNYTALQAQELRKERKHESK